MSTLDLFEPIPDVPKPAVRKTVSHSEVESFLRCERQHFYGYGLEIQRVTESDSLRRGILGHAALDVHFNALLSGETFDTAKERTFAFLAAEAPKMPLLAAEVMDCLTWFYKAYPFHGWTVHAVEMEFILPVTDDLEMPGAIDLIIEDVFGDLWVIDHKFVYDFVSDRDAELMPQIPKYVAALRNLGWNITKAAYSSLRYRTIKAPREDQKYQLTRVTLPAAKVRNSIREQIIASLRIQEIKANSVEQQSVDALRTANKMVCNSCSFRSLCVAEYTDNQPQLIMDTEYTKKQRREFAHKEIEQ